MPDGISTETIEGVELVKAGGPYFGVAGPKGGSRISEDDLDAAVAASDRIKAPVKLGHNTRQQAAQDAGWTTDDQPAVGWVENMRREGKSLVADLKDVPKQLADLMQAGAYRARSIEFKRGIRDEESTIPFALTGLSVLGARLPAVRGLKDVHALYQGDLAAYLSDVEEGTETILEEGDLAVASDNLPLAPLDTPFDESQARERVEALAGGDGSDEASASLIRRAHLRFTEDEFEFPIADVVEGELVAIPAAIFDVGEALAGDDHGLSESELHDARQTVSWYYGRMGRTPAWGDRSLPVDAFSANANGQSSFQTTGTITTTDAGNAPPLVVPQPKEGNMPDLTPELLEALGLGEDATAADAVAKVGELAQAQTDAEERAKSAESARDDAQAAATSGSDDDDKVAELAARVDTLEKEKEVLKEELGDARKDRVQRFEERRDAAIEKAVSEGRLAADDETREKWIGRFEATPDLAFELLDEAPVQTELAAEVGNEDRPDVGVDLPDGVDVDAASNWLTDGLPAAQDTATVEA